MGLHWIRLPFKMRMETATWVLVGAVALIALGFKIVEHWERAKRSFERTVLARPSILQSSRSNHDEAAMQDRSKEFDALVEHLQHALKLANDLEQNTLAFLIDRAIDEARAVAVTVLPPDRLQ